MEHIALVTGGAGFIGSHLCARLRDEGYRVISLDNYFTGTTDNHISGVEYRVGHTKDITRHISEHPDIIFHLGEYSRVEQSVLEPDVVHDLNVLGTEGVIAFWREHNTDNLSCKLVYAGSSTKFGDEGKARYTSPYAETKADNSEKVRTVGESEKMPYAITYFYNVYGEGERSGVYGTVVEHFKRMYLSGAPCAIVAPGTQQRNFTHVSDIVEGLWLVGIRGEGDEFGLGHERAYSIFELAELFGFGTNTVMFPERPGNRMSSGLDTTKIRTLGWKTERSLEGYIHEFTRTHTRGKEMEKRVLVFSTTFYPIEGLAEKAFVTLARVLPDVSFDVITTVFSKKARTTSSPAKNIFVHRIGVGVLLDKLLLPVFGAYTAIRLRRAHSFLFSWAVMASYAALAGLLFKLISGKPLLVTLADQNIDDLGVLKKGVFSFALSRSDQVYGSHAEQEKEASRLSRKALPRNSIGEGDAFANALRFAYADIVRKELLKS